MPTYEYACRDCGEHIEVVQSFRDDPLTVCPACKGNLRKVFSAAGIIFKGSGWHIKDYADKKPATADSTSGDKESKTSDSKKDAKSDSKSESKSGAKSDSKSDKKSDTTTASDSNAA